MKGSAAQCEQTRTRARKRDGASPKFVCERKGKQTAANTARTSEGVAGERGRAKPLKEITYYTFAWGFVIKGNFSCIEGGKRERERGAAGFRNPPVCEVAHRSTSRDRWPLRACVPRVRPGRRNATCQRERDHDRQTESALHMANH